MSIEALKREVGHRSCEHISTRFSDAKTVGIGTGSTIKYFIEYCRNYLRERKVVSSSLDTTFFLLTNSVTTVLSEFSVDKLDIYIDGADQVSSKLDMVKGRGGAFLREKVLAHISDYRVYIIDYTKYTGKEFLAPAVIPVEVVPFALKLFIREVVEKGLGEPVVRTGSGKEGPVISDNGNIIVDLKPREIIKDAEMYDSKIMKIPGVVATGIFPRGLVDEVWIAHPEGVIVLHK